MEIGNCCEHKMELIASGDYYVWEEDILSIEHREVYECENCGLSEYFVAEDEDEMLESEESFSVDI